MGFRPFSQFQFDAEAWRAEQARIMNTKLPRVAGAIAVKNIKKAFRAESYPTGSKWAKRKEGSPRNKGRKLLVDTGRLRTSVRHEAAGQVVKVYTDVPYAQVHNEGLQVTASQNVRAHSRRTRSGRLATVRAHVRKLNFKMPKRQFMPIPGERLPAPWMTEIDNAYRNMVRRADSRYWHGRTT